MQKVNGLVFWLRNSEQTLAIDYAWNVPLRISKLQGDHEFSCSEYNYYLVQASSWEICTWIPQWEAKRWRLARQQWRTAPAQHIPTAGGSPRRGWAARSRGRPPRPRPTGSPSRCPPTSSHFLCPVTGDHSPEKEMFSYILAHGTQCTKHDIHVKWVHPETVPAPVKISPMQNIPP